MRIYDALAQPSTREEREAVLRRIFPYSGPMFSNLIKSENDVFEKRRNERQRQFHMMVQHPCHTQETISFTICRIGK